MEEVINLHEHLLLNLQETAFCASVHWVMTPEGAPLESENCTCKKDEGS